MFAAEHQADQDRARREERRGHRSLDEDHSAIGRHDERLAQRLLEQGREHEGDHERGEVVLEFAQHVARDAEAEHHPEVEHVLVRRVGADNGEQQHDGKQHPVGHAQELHPESDEREVQQQQEDVPHVHACDDAPEEIGPLGHEERSGLDALDDQCAEEERGHRIARDAERQQRDHAAADGGVVGRLGAGDALDRPLSEPRRVARDATLDRIGHEGRRYGSAARHQPEQEAEPAAAQDRLPRRPPVVHRGPQPADALRHQRVAREMLDIGEDLGDAEEPDDHGEQLDARGQVDRAEGEPFAAVDHVDADCRGEECERDHEHALYRRAGDHVERADEAEHHQPEVLRRAEADRDRREHRGEERQQHQARRAGDERSERRDAERGAGAPLPRELVTVERGHHRSRLAGDVHQDRRRRAAVHRTVEDRGEHRQPGNRREREGHRQQQRERRERADPRQHPDQRADQAADQAVIEVRRREDDAEADGEALERAHRLTSPTGRVAATSPRRDRTAT